MKRKRRAAKVKQSCGECYGIGHTTCYTIENEEVVEVKVKCDKCRGKGTHA